MSLSSLFGVIQLIISINRLINDITRLINGITEFISGINRLIHGINLQATAPAADLSSIRSSDVMMHCLAGWLAGWLAAAC